MWLRVSLGLGLTLAGQLPAAVAHAEWKSVQQVTLGTAQVLEQGALTFGVFAPLAYGVSNRLTLQSHPILDLLLVPNVSGRYRLADGRTWIVSATGGFKRSYFQPGGADAATTAESPGEALAGATATRYLGSRWALTGSLLYSAHFDAPYKGDFEPLTHGLSASAEVHYLITPDDLLTGSVHLRQDFTLGRQDVPVGTLAWVHGFERFLGGAHLVLGVTAGDAAASGALGAWLLQLPVFPMVDLWWRL